MFREIRVLGVALAVLLPAVAVAQAPPTPQAEQLDPNACAKNRATVGQGGAMPVIPLPGTPGGDQSIQPK